MKEENECFLMICAFNFPIIHKPLTWAENLGQKLKICLVFLYLLGYRHRPLDDLIEKKLERVSKGYKRVVSFPYGVKSDGYWSENLSKN